MTKLDENVKKEPPSLVLPENLSDEELFAWAMKDVQSFPVQPDAPLIARVAVPGKLRDEDGETLQELHALVSGDVPFDSRFSEEYIEAALIPAARPLLRRLRRGDFAIEDTLDLHGMEREEARRQVESFLVQATLRRKGCVKVIHGRGHNSKENRAVLKGLLQNWLATRRLSRHVLAYTSARPCDGGYGAVYVLLRRAPKPGTAPHASARRKRKIPTARSRRKSDQWW